MKTIKFLLIASLSMSFLLSCEKNENNDPDNPNTTDLVTAENITYEANGSFTYTDAATSTPKTYTYTHVKAQYKDVSHIWPNTYYTNLSFYSIKATAAAEMITFIFLGKEFPKTGTYKMGPNGIAITGISETDKLLANEVAIQVVANGNVSKRDDLMSIDLINTNGKITITSSNEIEVYDNLMGNLRGTCKNINITRTTKKL